jgi:hypothetical protein
VGCGMQVADLWFVDCAECFGWRLGRKVVRMV